MLTSLLRKLYPDAEILGVDNSEEMINFVRNKYGKIAKFEHIDFLNYNKQHDLAISFYSFCFFPLVQGVERIKNIITPGGIGIVVICGKSLFSIVHRFLLDKFFGSKLSLYSPKDFQSLFKKTGFCVSSRIISKFEGSYILIIKKINEKSK